MERIVNLDAPELEVYTKLNEKQAKRFFEPEEGLFICESLRVIKRAIKAGYEPVSFFVEEGLEEEILPFAETKDIPVYKAPYEVMRGITGYSLTGGVLSAMRRKPLQDFWEFLTLHYKIVLLDQIENPTNVGAIFRSAAALGADGIILTPGCADPLYRRAARVSMGTVFQVGWTYGNDRVMSLLREAGYKTFALALSEDAVPIEACADLTTEKTAVIMGNEDHGISEEILSACDHITMIPMANGVDSLNVAAASAIAFWEFFGHKTF